MDTTHRLISTYMKKLLLILLFSLSAQAAVSPYQRNTFTTNILSPTAILNVNGITLTNATTIGSTNAVFGVHDATPDATVEIINDGVGDSFIVADSLDADSTAFGIGNNGNVFIGHTSSGGWKLRVAAASVTDAGFLLTGYTSFGGSIDVGGAANWGANNMNVVGKLGFGSIAATARLHLPAGTAAATTAPLKLTSGTVMTAPEAGAVEFDGSKYYMSVGSVRYTVSLRNGAPLVTYSAGTAATLTDTAAALDFGTTDPAVVISNPGTYRLSAWVNVKSAGATIAAETYTLKIRRTNNTAADVTESSVTVSPRSMTTTTETLGVIQLPNVFYTTVNSDDSLTIFGNVSVTLAAGTITAVQANIIAERMF